MINPENLEKAHKLIKSVRIENKRGVLQLENGKEYYLTVLNVEKGTLDRYTEKQWMTVAEFSVQILLEQGILEGDHSFNSVNISESGIDKSGHKYSHTKNTSRLWNIYCSAIGNSQVVVNAKIHEIRHVINQKIYKLEQGYKNKSHKFIVSLTQKKVNDSANEVYQELSEELKEIFDKECARNIFRQTLQARIIEIKSDDLHLTIKNYMHQHPQEEDTSEIAQAIEQDLQKLRKVGPKTDPAITEVVEHVLEKQSVEKTINYLKEHNFSVSHAQESFCSNFSIQKLAHSILPESQKWFLGKIFGQDE